MYEDEPQDKVFDVLGEAVFGEHPLGRPIIGRAEVVRDTPLEAIGRFHADRYVPGQHGGRGGGVGRSRRGGGAGARAPARRCGPRRGGARPARSPDDAAGRACASSARTPSSTTCAWARRASPATTSAASPCACWTTCWAVPAARGCSRRCASAAAWPTACTRSPASTPAPARWGSTWVRGATPWRPRSAWWATSWSGCAGSRSRADELERSKENVKGRLVLSLESTSARMNRLGSSVLTGVPLLTVDELIERIDARHAGRRRGAGRELLDPAAPVGRRDRRPEPRRRSTPRWTRCARRWPRA